MKILLLLTETLTFSFLALKAHAAPTTSTDITLPAGWSPITREEILDRLYTSPNIKGNLLTKRTPGSIYLCTGSHWRGTCGYAVQQVNTCIVLDAPWKNAVSSMGVDKGADVVLFPSSAYNCMGSEAGNSFGDLQYPGLDDFATRGWNNKLGMFKWTLTLTGA